MPRRSPAAANGRGSQCLRLQALLISAKHGAHSLQREVPRLQRGSACQRVEAASSRQGFDGHVRPAHGPGPSPLASRAGQHPLVQGVWRSCPCCLPKALPCPGLPTAPSVYTRTPHPGFVAKRIGGCVSRVPNPPRRWVAPYPGPAGPGQPGGPRGPRSACAVALAGRAVWPCIGVPAACRREVPGTGFPGARRPVARSPAPGCGRPRPRRRAATSALNWAPALAARRAGRTPRARGGPVPGRLSGLGSRPTATSRWTCSRSTIRTSSGRPSEPGRLEPWPGFCTH